MVYMSKFVLSKKADDDLAGIFEYGIVNFGIERATEYLLGINDKFNLISNNKELGRTADEISKDLKRVSQNRHVIFFKEMKGSVMIVRDLRREMDFERHL